MMVWYGIVTGDGLVGPGLEIMEFWARGGLASQASGAADSPGVLFSRQSFHFCNTSSLDFYIMYNCRRKLFSFCSH